MPLFRSPMGTLAGCVLRCGIYIVVFKKPHILFRGKNGFQVLKISLTGCFPLTGTLGACGLVLLGHTLAGLFNLFQLLLLGIGQIKSFKAAYAFKCIAAMPIATVIRFT